MIVLTKLPAKLLFFFLLDAEKAEKLHSAAVFLCCGGLVYELVGPVRLSAAYLMFLGWCSSISWHSVVVSMWVYISVVPMLSWPSMA